MPSYISKIFGTKNEVETAKVFIKDYLTIPYSAYNNGEAAVERNIAKQLVEEFDRDNVKTQYAVGGFLNLKCDIDLYDGKCGIELKLAKSLTASELQRVIGQVYYYSQRVYKNTGLILLVVGTKEEIDPKLKELKCIVEQIPGVHFMYKQAKSKKS